MSGLRVFRNDGRLHPGVVLFRITHPMTRIAFLTSCIALAGVSPAALVASYNFNEAAGSASIADGSGNGYTATQATLDGSTLGRTSVTAGTYGALTVTASDAANFGTAAGFNGSGGARFDINAPGATAISGLLTKNGTASPNGRFTLMAWIFANNHSNTFFLGTGDGLGNGWKWGLNVQEAFVTVNVQQNLGGTTVSTGGWHHVAFTYDNGAATFYLDGNLAGTATYTNFNEDTVLASIGARPTGSEAFNGMMDDLKIYDTALDLNGIRASAVPEPTTYGLLGAGALAAVSLGRRRRR